MFGGGCGGGSFIVVSLLMLLLKNVSQVVGVCLKSECDWWQVHA